MTSTTPSTTSNATGERTLSDTETAIRSAIESAIAGDDAPYTALPTKSRNSVKSALDARMRRAIDTDEFAAAKSVKSVLVRLESITTKKATIDPMVALANNAATFRLAADMIEFGLFVPDGVEVPVPTGSPVVSTESGLADVSAAVRLATKSVVRSGKVSDVASAIIAAMDELAPESGDTATVGAICEHWANNGGPDTKSRLSGRVTARLFSDSDKTVKLWHDAGIVPNPESHPQSASRA